MSTDEQALILGKMLLELREKKTTSYCLQKQMGDVVQATERVLALYKATPHGEELEQALRALPPDDALTQTLSRLLHVEAEITALKKTLEL